MKAIVMPLLAAPAINPAYHYLQETGLHSPEWCSR